MTPTKSQQAQEYAEKILNKNSVFELDYFGLPQALLDGVPDDADFRDLSEVTWSEERMFDNDIEYVIGKEAEG